MAPATKNDPPDVPPTRDVMWYARELHKRTPYIYDKAKLYWIWQENHYAMVDETDISSLIYDLTVDPKYLSGQFKAAIHEAIRITGRKATVKEKPKEWVHFKNCIIDLKTWKIIKPSPEYLLTEPIPHKYHEDHDTPTIDALFHSWVDHKYVKTLYEVCAYALLDDYPIHRVFLLHGKGRNGKGQFRDILTRIVGDNNTTAITLEGLVLNRFESSRLFKKKLCTIGETNFKAMENTSIFKMAIGGDPLPAEYKGKTQFTFRNTAKMVINTNSLPQTKDKTDGFYSKWVFLNFKNQFHKGKDIIDKIPPDEYDNLVSKSILTLRELLDNGEFHEEGSIRDKMLKYEAVSNPLREFIADKCTVNINDVVPFQHFSEEFTEYLKNRGLRTYSINDLRKYIGNEGFTLRPDYRFSEINRRLTAVLGIDLKVNKRMPKTKVSDGTLDSYSAGTTNIESQQ